MIKRNELKIVRFNGTERFEIVTGECFTVGDGDDLRLWFEIQTTADGAKCCADTSEYPRTPNAELGIPITGFNVENFLGCQFQHAGTSNDDEDSCDSIFYYHEHQPLRDNKVTVLQQLSGQTFRIRWTARTHDVVDFRNPEAQIEIECDFHVRQ